MRTYRWLVIILIVVAAAIWIDLPNNPGIHFAGINREIETRLGLDLVGGVQALLEADLPAGTAVDAEKMRTATRIVENRVNGLGVTEALVQQAGEQRIVVELPGIEDPTVAIATIQETGLLEFVDMGSTPLIAGAVIVTDIATSESPQPDEQVWHTVMTGDAIENVQFRCHAIHLDNTSFNSDLIQKVLKYSQITPQIMLENFWALYWIKLSFLLPMLMSPSLKVKV
jgi:preprotein translocase subunit SecD